MRVLVTGGTGVIGKPTVDLLLERGHEVRLLSRHAARDVEQWAGGVQPVQASISDRPSLSGVAEGCEAIVHIAGIIAEDPPEITFRKINVEGTRNLTAEAEQAGVGRFIYISSLGADRGESEYHKSKREAEALVRGFSRNWLILRPGNVYGPGDDVISLLLKMVRTLPAVPVVGTGDHPFQPIWAEDLAEAIAQAVEREEPSRRALDLAGLEVTSTSDVLDRLERITQKNPPRMPVPEFLAQAGAGMAEALGLELPVNSEQLTMLVEENVVQPGTKNALTDVFGITPTPLDEGLAKLADALPERLPSEGTGSLQRQRYWADIRGSRMTPREILEMVRTEFYSLAPEDLLEVGAEPGTQRSLELGETITMQIPLRGTIQVRVTKIEEDAITLATLEGHPLSGVIRFSCSEHDRLTRFEVRSYTRASDVIDLLGMRTVGSAAQKATWEAVVEAVVRRSGGEAVGGIQQDAVDLDEDAAETVEDWVEDLVMDRKRKTHDIPSDERVTERQVASTVAEQLDEE